MHLFVKDYKILQILKYSGLNILSKYYSKKSILYHTAIHGPPGESFIDPLYNCPVLCFYQPDLYRLAPLLYAERCAREQIEDAFLSDKDRQMALEFLQKIEGSVLVEDQVEH